MKASSFSHLVTQADSHMQLLFFGGNREYASLAGGGFQEPVKLMLSKEISCTERDSHSLGKLRQGSETV